MSGSPSRSVALVVLAAGMGRRFGALKQVSPIGPGDEAIVDFTIHDAAAAGATEVIVVVRPEIRDEVVGHLARRSPLPLTVVEQAGPVAPRAKPWGAAEAVALALDRLDGGFGVVVNADDHYGADSVAAAVGWCIEHGREDQGALVTWPLGATTSDEGGVSRAVCRLDGSGRLLGMVEHHEIVSDDDGIHDPTGYLPADAPVSMNLWALPTAIAAPLGAHVATFKDAHSGNAGAELALPTAIDFLIADATLTVTTLPAGTTWVGVTHPGDLEPARAALAHLSPLPILESR